MRRGVVIFFSSRTRHTRCSRDWRSDVCSSDLTTGAGSALGGWILNHICPGEGSRQRPYRLFELHSYSCQDSWGDIYNVAFLQENVFAGFAPSYHAHIIDLEYLRLNVRVARRPYYTGSLLPRRNANVCLRNSGQDRITPGIYFHSGYIDLAQHVKNLAAESDNANLYGVIPDQLIEFRHLLPHHLDNLPDGHAGPFHLT